MWSHPTRLLVLLTAFLTVLAGVPLHTAEDHSAEGASIAACHAEGDGAGGVLGETAEEERQEEEEKSAVHFFSHHAPPIDAAVDRSERALMTGIGRLPRSMRPVLLIRGPPAV